MTIESFFIIWGLISTLMCIPLTNWRMSTGKVTLFDLFNIILLAVLWPFGIIVLVFVSGPGQKIIIWQKEDK